MPTINKLAVPTTVYTREYDENGTYSDTNGSYNLVGTESKVFLLSQADLYGKTGNDTANALEYTYVDAEGNGIQIFKTDIMASNNYYATGWMRSTFDKDTVGQMIQEDSIYPGLDTGVHGANPVNSGLDPAGRGDSIYCCGYYHAAFWVDISSADIYAD